MIGPEGTDNCHKFVDILGLRTIFPLFMKSPKKIKKVGTTEKEHEGRCASRSFLLPQRRWIDSQCLKSTCREEGRHSTHLCRAPSAVFRSGCPACCSLSQLAVEGTLVLLVLVSAAPGYSISCAVNKLFYSCRVCCLKLLLWCKTLLKRVMRQLQMSPQKQCFHGSEHWSVTGWTSAIAEINCIAFEVAFFSFLYFLTLYPGKLL